MKAGRARTPASGQRPIVRPEVHHAGIYARWLVVALLLFAAQRVAGVLQQPHDMTMLLCLHGPAGDIDAEHIAQSGGYFWLDLLFGIFLEELLFRRLLIGFLTRVAALRSSNVLTVLSALSFAVAHFGYWLHSIHWNALICLAIVGAVFAKVYLYRGSLIDSTFVHFTYDAVLAAPLLHELDRVCLFVAPASMVLWGIAAIAMLCLCLLHFVDPAFGGWFSRSWTHLRRMFRNRSGTRRESGDQPL